MTARARSPSSPGRLGRLPPSLMRRSAAARTTRRIDARPPRLAEAGRVRNAWRVLVPLNVTRKRMIAWSPRPITPASISAFKHATPYGLGFSALQLVSSQAEVLKARAAGPKRADKSSAGRRADKLPGEAGQRAKY